MLNWVVFNSVKHHELYLMCQFCIGSSKSVLIGIVNCSDGKIWLITRANICIISSRGFNNKNEKYI